MKIHKLSAYGLGAFVLTFGATLAFGQARVPFTRPPYVITPGSIQTSASADQFVCTSTTATCEVESSASAATMTATVPAFDIGPTATPEANDRLACFSYGPSGSKTRVACVDVEGDMNATSLLLATTNPGVRFHVLNETTSYAPTSFDEKHSVFGRNPLTGAGSGGLFMTYHTTDNEGVVGALSPAIAWRPLSFSASAWNFRPNGLAAIANITSTGAFNSVATSGNQAFTCTNTGCRLSLGNTGRYLVDDGTNLEFVAPVQGTSFEATTATGNSLSGGSSTGPLLITSNTPDSFASTTASTMTVRPAASVATGDTIFLVETSTNESQLRVRTGAVGTMAQVVSGNYDGRFSGSTFTSFNSAITMDSWVATTEANPVRLRTLNSYTADTANIVSIYNASTQVATFSKDGLLRVNQANAARPTCNADNRGRLFFLDGAAGVADTMQVCMKDASNNYDWETVASP